MASPPLLKPFVPLGLALDAFGPDGRWRASEGGFPIDTKIGVSLPGVPGRLDVADAKGLVTAIAASPTYHRCLSSSAFRFHWAGFSCGLTNAATLTLDDDCYVADPARNLGSHEISHNYPEHQIRIDQMFVYWYGEMLHMLSLAGLLDTTMVVWLNDTTIVHGQHDRSVLLGGGGALLKTGQFVDLTRVTDNKDKNLNKLLTTMARASGLDVSSIGDASLQTEGPLRQVLG